MAIRAGELRHPARIERRSGSRTTYGDVGQTWTTVRSPRVKIEPLSGRELVEAQQVAARVTHRIWLRHNADILPGDRIVARGRTFEIVQAVTVNELDRESHVLAIEAPGAAA